MTAADDTVDRTKAKQRRTLKRATPLESSSIWTRRFRELILAHAEDMGGVASLSESQKAILRRAAALQVALENQEGLMATGEAVDLDQYSRLSNSLKRLLESLGMQKKPKDLVISIDEIAKRHKKGALEP